MDDIKNQIKEHIEKALRTTLRTTLLSHDGHAEDRIKSVLAQYFHVSILQVELVEESDEMKIVREIMEEIKDEYKFKVSMQLPMYIDRIIFKVRGQGLNPS